MTKKTKQEKILEIPEKKTFVAKQEAIYEAESVDALFAEIEELEAAVPKAVAPSLAPLPGAVPNPVYVPAKVKSRFDA